MPTVTEWAGRSRRVDVIILTAIQLEFDALLQVDAGAIPGSAWEELPGPSGLPVMFRSFLAKSGRPLRVAAAVSSDMGAVAATNTLLPLVETLRPRCIAMCGVCAGRRGKTQLGDVVAADRLFYHDTGKRLPGGILQDLTTYKLRDDWKVALQRMDVIARFRDEAWFRDRPVSTDWRERRTLVALRNSSPEPWKHVDPKLDVHTWKPILTALMAEKLLETTEDHAGSMWHHIFGRKKHLHTSPSSSSSALVNAFGTLTRKGRRAVDKLLVENMGALPDLSPAGTFQPFRLHVAPLASGSQVIEDESIWAFISQSMRQTLALEMEGAALGELAHRQRQHGLDAIVMKGIMDFADHGRDDHFKEFAARASAECLLVFLREHVPTELTTGFDDLLTLGTVPAALQSQSPSSLLLAQHTVVPWHGGGRSGVLADLDAWADDPKCDIAVQLLHGVGGIGKTRMAIEWVQRRRGRFDVAGFLEAHLDNTWLERLCGLGPPVLIVVDYAENRADLIDLLQQVAGYRARLAPGRRLRLLLLARGDGDWWTELRRRSVAIQALLGDIKPMALPPVAVSAPDRAAVFVEAATVFAKLRDRASIKSSPIVLDDARFERVLYLHMAAFAAVEGVAFDAGTLMDAILDHEERFWVTEATARHDAIVDLRLARQLIAAATLRGGLSTEEDVQDMYERLARRPRTRTDDVIITLLHHVYAHSKRSGYLPGLEPDLLGEAMVVRVAALSRARNAESRSVSAGPWGRLAEPRKSTEHVGAARGCTRCDGRWSGPVPPGSRRGIQLNISSSLRCVWST